MPGKLTKEEFETMKEHTLIDASMLDKLEHYKDEKMIKIAYQICRWHHERYDGKGYPDGLIGEQIPIAAQVVSVADVYDALVSKRVYKDAYSHEQAGDEDDPKRRVRSVQSAFNGSSCGNPGQNKRRNALRSIKKKKCSAETSAMKNQLYFPNELCIINKIFILYTKNKKMKDEEENLSILEGNKGCYLQLSRSIM